MLDLENNRLFNILTFVLWKKNKPLVKDKSFSEHQIYTYINRHNYKITSPLRDLEIFIKRDNLHVSGDKGAIGAPFLYLDYFHYL